MKLFKKTILFRRYTDISNPYSVAHNERAYTVPYHVDILSVDYGDDRFSVLLKTPGQSTRFWFFNTRAEAAYCFDDWCQWHKRSFSPDLVFEKTLAGFTAFKVWMQKRYLKNYLYEIKFFLFSHNPDLRRSYSLFERLAPRIVIRT